MVKHFQALWSAARTRTGTKFTCSITLEKNVTFLKEEEEEEEEKVKYIGFYGINTCTGTSPLKYYFTNYVGTIPVPVPVLVLVSSFTCTGTCIILEIPALVPVLN